MTSVQPDGGWQVVAYRFTTLLIEHALGELAERVERMPDDRFLAEHQAAHDEPRSPAVDIVSAVLEREWRRRWPEGKGGRCAA